VLDSLIFADNRYHLSVLTFTLLAPETLAFLAFYFVVAVAIEVIDALGVQQRGTALDAVHDIALRQQEIGEIGAILTGDPGNERDFTGHMPTFRLLSRQE